MFLLPTQSSLENNVKTWGILWERNGKGRSQRAFFSWTPTSPSGGSLAFLFFFVFLLTRLLPFSVSRPALGAGDLDETDLDETCFLT